MRGCAQHHDKAYEHGIRAVFFPHDSSFHCSAKEGWELSKLGSDHLASIATLGVSWWQNIAAPPLDWAVPPHTRRRGADFELYS